MADHLPLVKLVASVRGFYEGHMVEPGQEFMFDPNSKVLEGPPRKYPKWAAPVGGVAAKKPPPDAKAFDTKPPAAAAAAKIKLGKLTG